VERTDPLAPVGGDEPSRPDAAVDPPTAALPLLDLLAPQRQQEGSAGAPSAAPAPESQEQPTQGPPQHYAEQPYAEQPYAEQPYAEQRYSNELYTNQLYSNQLLAGQQPADRLLSGQPYGDPLLAGEQYDPLVAGQPYQDPPYAAAAPAGVGTTVPGQAAGPPGPPRTGPHGWPLVAIIAGCVVLLGLIGWLAIGSLPSGEEASSTSTSATAAPTPTSSVIVAGDYQFIQHSARSDTDCAGNAYGQVAEFFRTNPCSGLRRLLLTSSAAGKPVVVSVSTVTMPDDAKAAALKKLADTNGTGNVADLLRAGVRVPSVPANLSDASYASSHGGNVVVIVEADYTDPGQRADDALERITQAAVELGQG